MLPPSVRVSIERRTGYARSGIGTSVEGLFSLCDDQLWDTMHPELL